MYKLSIKVILVLACATTALSCQKRIDEAYANPNTFVRVSPEQLLPQIVNAMAANYAGHGPQNDMRYVGQYVQNWQYYLPLGQFDRMGYINGLADVAQSTWRMHYYDIGQNNEKMIQWALEEKKWDYAGVGKGISAWSWLTLTTYYGEVIQKEAFNTDLITFKYDSQEDVYKHVRKLCHESLELLNKTGDNASQANLAKGDAYFYKGDVNKWKKFVYGVLARSFNHLSNKAGVYQPDSVIKYCDLSINTNADNAILTYQALPAVTATMNYYGPARGNLNVTTTPVSMRQSAYIANLMNGSNSAFAGVEDPRAIYMLRLNANNTFKGLRPNKGQGDLAANDRPENFWGVPQIVASNSAPANDNASRYVFRNASPFPIMTASEIKFMKAEAAMRKNQRGTAHQAYIEAISLNFDMLTETYNVNIPAGREITPASKAAYLANTIIVPDPANLTLSKIMLQKYIAMFAHGILETWVDMRRYHYVDADPTGTGQVYADFTPPSGTDLFPDNNGKLIYRYYPRFNSEYVWNRLELDRIGALSSTYHTEEMWFSKP